MPGRPGLTTTDAGTRAARLLPFLRWRSRVDRHSTRSDLMAGVTGALIVLPQGVAFATIAGLPPEYGLYAAMVPAVIAALFGSSWHLVTGPTTAISIVVFASVSPLADPGSDDYIRLVLTLTLVTGLFQLVMGLARMGALVNFISHTVVIGFTAGAAVLIVTSQVKSFLGLDLERGLAFHEVVYQASSRLSDTNLYVVSVAVATLVTGIVLRRLLPRLHMIVALVVGSLTAVLLDRFAGGSDVTGITTVGALSAGLPPISMPDLSPSALGQVVFPALVVTMLGLTEAVSISRAIAVKSEQRIDGNQEFIGQGLGNLVGSFFSSYAVSGSFNRSGVNHAAGARTPLAAVYASVFLVLILAAISPLAAYLPTAAMAGLLVLVAFGLIDFHHIRSILRASKQETAVLLVTFVGTLIDLEKGIVFGILLSLLLYLSRTSRPEMAPVVPDPDPDSYYFVSAEGRQECPQYKMVRIHGSLFFGAVNHVQGELHKIDERAPEQRHVLLAARGMNFVDIAGAELLVQEARRRRNLGGGLYLYRVQTGVQEALQQGPYLDEIGQENIFPTKSHPIDSIYPRLDSEICRSCTARIFSPCHVALPNGEPRTESSRPTSSRPMSKTVLRVAGLSGAGRTPELRADREPVAADEGVAPLQGSTPVEPDSLDGQGGDVRCHLQHGQLGARRYDGPQVLAAARERDAAPGAQLGVQRGLGEVDLEQGCGDLRGHPHAIEGQRTVAGQPQPLEVEQRHRRLERQSLGHHAVGADVAPAHDAALGLTGFAHGGEKAVERAHLLVDLGRARQARGASPLSGHHAGLAEPPERLTHRVPTHGVLTDERELPWERVGELAVAHPADEVGVHLLPQRRRESPVHGAGTGDVGAPTGAGHLVASPLMAGARPAA